MYERWLKNPIRFVAMTGYTPALFEDLMPYFTEAHNAYFSRYDISGKKKKQFRAFVIYTNSPLPTIEETGLPLS